MYAKLFSRITESSLMEEPVNVRYTFVMLLAIADPKGYVVGTDVAIARRINLPLKEFQECIEALKRPDQNSNSEAEEGRRILDSDTERGYFLVNYMTYRDARDSDQRREYMRGYMAEVRAGKAPGKRKPLTRVNRVSNGKHSLAQAEAEEEAEAEIARDLVLGMKIRDLHKSFEASTGEVNPYDGKRIATWLSWHKAGFTEEDLKRVLHYVRRNMQPEGVYRTESVLFRNLIGDVDKFREKLQLAKGTLNGSTEPVQKIPCGADYGIE